jgi:hypothetical protein
MKLKIYFLSFFVALFSIVNSPLFSQCATNAYISNGSNCISLSWSGGTSIPSPLPVSIEFNGSVYVYGNGSGDLAFPAVYKIIVGNTCPLPSDVVNGNITFNYASGAITCSYGVLLALHDLSFTAVANQQRNTLQWSMKEDENSGNYAVERSLDGEAFSGIYSINAKATGVDRASYEYNDEQPLHTTYYRLKMIEKNGASWYSKIVKVQNDNIKAAITVYPNPNKGSFIITGIDSKDIASLNIVDVQGRKIAFKATGNNGNQSVNITVYGSSRAMYFAQYVSGTTKMTTRFLVQ